MHISHNFALPPIKTFGNRLVSTRISGCAHYSNVVTPILIIESFIFRRHLRDARPKSCHVIVPTYPDALHIVVDDVLQIRSVHARHP